jgi:hypothetical protein
MRGELQADLLSAQTSSFGTGVLQTIFCLVTGIILFFSARRQKVMKQVKQNEMANIAHVN